MRFLCLLPLGAVFAQTPAPPKPAVTKPAVTPAKPAASPAKAAAAPAKPVTPAKPAAMPAKPAAAAAKADPAVIIIGDLKITQSEWERFVTSLPEQIRAQATGPTKRKMVEQYADLRMLAQEARRRGVDKDPKTAAQIAFQADNLLANTLMTTIVDSSPANDAAVKAYYDSHKKEYEQIKGRHILIRSQCSRVPLKPDQKDLTDAEALAKAQELAKALAGGKDFAELAKAESDDTGSGAQGGDLGTFGHGQMVPEFETAAFGLEPGKISDPVKTPFGYHLIQVQDRVDKKIEDVRKAIEAQLKPDAAKKAIEELRKNASIIIDDAYFGK